MNRARSLLLLSMSSLVGCDTGTEAKPDLADALNWDAGFETNVTTTVDTDEPTITTEPVSENMFYLDSPQENYPVRLQEWDPVTRQVIPGQPCQVNLDGLQAGDHKLLYCMMDVNELDLHVLGYPLNVNIPGGTCDFYQVDWYMYEDWRGESGPTELNIRINPDGTITDDPNTFFGEAFCEFDYRPFGPNCCFGGYTLTVDDQITGQIYTVPGFWGGYPGDCYDGTAYIMAPAFSLDSHLPLSEIVHVDKDAYKAYYDVVQDLTEYGTNVGVANYYDPAEHSENKPAGLTRTYSREYNSFYCLDDADEIYAELRLIVREWNTEAEFNVQGDADVVGLEPGGDALDDIHDWATLAPSDVVWTYDLD